MPSASELLDRRWVWAGLAVGVAVSCFIFLLGLLVIRRRGRTRLLAAALRELNAKPDAEEERGRRGSNRRRSKLVEVLVAQEGAPGRPLRGYVMDRSASGLGLALPDRVRVGDTLRVRATHAPAGSPWVPVWVMHHKPLGKGFAQAGCRFPEPPPWNVLLLFG